MSGEVSRTASFIARLAGGLRTLVVGTLLSLSALGSVILLGWLMALMRRRALLVAGLPLVEHDHPRWLLSSSHDTFPKRLAGGLGGNISRGVAAAASLAIATFPFAVFWMVAWWAGWENSFNKGYEYAFVGPMVGFAGILLFAVVMVFVPMALVHQVVEQRPFSFFELRRVRSVVSHTGPSYILWAAACVILSFPIFLSRALPAFAEDFFPAISELTIDEAAGVKLAISLAVGLYLFVTLMFLKRWSAGIYARAAKRAAASVDAPLWQNSAFVSDNLYSDGKTPWRIARLARLCLLIVIWAGLAGLIFVGQFVNHAWHVWLTHPVVFLPWVM
ncbi:MAG: hypothetical protein KUG58_08730 [Marinosulfonomonas sp.]|nr:hypothetical protein [Marinosulfonomonas sp.]